MIQARVRSYLQTVLRYDDANVRAKSRSVLPLERLQTEAHDAVEIAKEFGSGEVLMYEDYLVENLAHWFKGEFFSWVTTPPCWNCGSGETRLKGMAEPSVSELQHGAERVEAYQCPKCGAEIRFPRYNDPAKLMETRKGRCGEWANAFTCLCRSLDMDARFVVDWTDHVWTEFYSTSRQRWIHVDCCECVVDKPKLYESGWGKKLSYIFAMDRNGVADVTRRYVNDWNTTLTRRKEISESQLEAVLREISTEQRSLLSIEDQHRLNQRETAERKEMMEGRVDDTQEALPGRTTGSVEWRDSRGESGTGPKQRVLRIATSRFRRVDLLDGTGARRKIAVRGSGEKPPDETVSHLFDGDPSTKWLDFGGKGMEGSAWIECCIPKSEPALMLGSYALVSANDCQQRDPAEWELQGLPEGTDREWRVLDHQCGVIFERRHKRKLFVVNTLIPVRRLRLCIWKTQNPPSADAVQLAQLEFFPAEEKTTQRENATALQLEGKMQQLFDLFAANGQPS